jgi:tRNA A-37 threonylcarbamoyl transferase component Bud32/WD40 repeat protein
MALAAGDRLGSYEILAPLGAGGMGEVYRARDPRLGRDVAIKVLPTEVAGDPERLARFQREATLLASLNHSHIGAIYGLEEDDGSPFLVLELVEGEDLAERLKRGPLPVDEALAIARQVAEALEEAHDKGIIHRDLKPANVKVTPDGKVKVLDFGLAKAWAADPDSVAGSSSTLSQSPTLAHSGTLAGVILGTAAYMSPEQAKAKKVDKRTDVWAFGTLVYEMLTGRRAFQGDDVSDTLAAVLRTEADFAQLPRDTPPELRRVLRLCLVKDARCRIHDIADVRLAMGGAFGDVSEAAETAGAFRRLPWAVALLMSLAMGFVVGTLMRTTPSEPREVTRFSYELPADQRLRNQGRAVLAVSPDGRRFVYNARGGVQLRSMDQLEAHVLPGTEDSLNSVFFSPDGRSIGYFQRGQLKRLALSGGAPVVVCSAASSPLGAHWARDNTILFAAAEGIWRVPASGGTPELIIAAAEGEVLDAPQLLPDESSVLVSIRPRLGTGTAVEFAASSWDGGRIAVASLNSGERTVLLEGGSDARYVASGHIAYALDDGLLAVAFDARSLRVTSGPVSMVQGLSRARTAASANYAVTDDGSLYYLAAGRKDTAPLGWVDRTGRVEVIEAIPPNEYQWPRLSPAGDRLLVLAEGDAWIYDLGSGRQSRLTDDGATNYLGWAPSGRDITYTSARGSVAGEVWIQPADGSGEARQLTALGGRVDFDNWAPDGRTFSAHHHVGGTTNQLMAAFDGDTAETETWLEHEYDDLNAAFSPDGRFVAYVSNQTGQSEIYIRPYPGPGGQAPVSVGGGKEPLWAPTGELFYRRSSDYMMMGVAVSTDPALTLGPLVELFEGRADAANASPTPAYDVTADGQRFVMSTSLVASGESGPEADRRAKVVVVQNWVEELRGRVPVD